MYFHIILSEACNSRCRYCYEKSQKEFGGELDKKFHFDFSAPCHSELNVNILKKFIKKDKSPKIIFYGGEPLLNQEKMIEIMKQLPDMRYFIQTNGKLLNELPKQYVQKFSKILISIDGDKERTDFNRGKGTYDLVIKNIDLIRKNAFRGEIMARMTISFTDGFTDLFTQVKNLINTGKFNSYHWQLDMGFYESDYNKEKVAKFLKAYNWEVSKLLDFWVEEMQRGKVWRIYPFLGIFDSLYHKTKTKLRCGSGYANYTITTDGKIVACPITSGIKEFQVGDIAKDNPNELPELKVKEPCPSCDYFNLCGGRCLYSNYAKLWPKEGQEQICSSIKYLIDEMKKRIPEIKHLIETKTIQEAWLDYEKYFGPEIIP
ncbi:TIGR04084 family radical SAM/SPASM domain-containing protein [Candidatus Pacearchaeota archaeon]|jgi:putative peptide-modifying radical SAM enzyme|nr:TIGR04084 family radical SAM/SPASM domain-containing protein [Candidatus Pacearchaeota archaeon]